MGCRKRIIAWCTTTDKSVDCFSSLNQLLKTISDNANSYEKHPSTEYQTAASINLNRITVFK